MRKAGVRLRAGLCAFCCHGRAATNARGARFVLCGLAATDAGFSKYPALPVLAGRGFEPSRPDK